MTYTVILSPEALAQLADLDAHLAAAASPEIAARYTAAIVDFCFSLRIFGPRLLSDKELPFLEEALALANPTPEEIEAFNEYLRKNGGGTDDP